MKKYIVLLLALAIAGIGLYYCCFYNKQSPASDNSIQKPDTPAMPAENQKKPLETEKIANVEPASTTAPANEPAEKPKSEDKTVIGKSAGGKDIAAYHFGTGDTEVLFIGGTHGGYAWNTALLGYQLVDYLKTNPSEIPPGVKATVIPVLNPDGLSKVVDSDGPFTSANVSRSEEAGVAGRFNANNVDINRNFDCEWKAQGVWQKKTVSGGTAAFSEPESAAIRDYANGHRPVAVVAWFSAGGGVFPASCGGSISTETQKITDIYAKASGYAAKKDFDYYQVSGDMTNWFAKNNVPAIGVMLLTHDDIEWGRNLAGSKAILDNYSK